DGERAAEVHDLRRAERQSDSTDSEAGRPGPRQDREGGESDGRERNQRNEATLRVEKLLQDDGSSEPGPQSERESEERVGGRAHRPFVERAALIDQAHDLFSRDEEPERDREHSPERAQQIRARRSPETL